MNPFRRPTSGRERLAVLAERLIVSMVGAKVDLPSEASPDALWTLGIAVAGWWLKGNPEVDSVIRSVPSLPVLFEVFESVKTLPMFAATAAGATDYVALARGSGEFVKVMSELGPGKLKAALGNALFGRLKAQIVSKFPAPADLADAISSQPKPAPTSTVLSRSRESVGTSVSQFDGRAVDIPRTDEPPKVSPTTIAFLRTLYREDEISRILKG